MMKNTKKVINIIYLTIFYKVFYSEDKKGYMMKKRVLPFLLISPMVLPFWMLCSISNYIIYILEYKSQWVELKDDSKKLTFKQRLVIKLNFH